MFCGFKVKGETEFFQVKFEKFPMLFHAYGKMGHWHEERGTGEYGE